MLVPSTNGVRAAAHHLGGAGQPLLVCHSAGLCGQAYGPLAARLIQEFAVWAIDFRGHGDATVPANGDFAWTGMAQDVLAVVDALGVQQIFGVGHSLGGAVLLLAELARPGLLHGAFLYEPIVMPSGFGDGDASHPLAQGSRRRRPSFASRGDALIRYAKGPPLGLLRADALAAYVEHGFADRSDGTVALKCSPESESRTFESFGSITVDMVRGMPLRAVVARGLREAAQPEPGRIAPEIAAALPGARLVEYPHLGHFGPLQDPESVGADIVAAFLA